MKNLFQVIIFFISLYVGSKIIRYFGGIYVSHAAGYKIGNRNRLVSILVLQWIMGNINILIHQIVLSLFKPPFTLCKFGGRVKSPTTQAYIRRLRSRTKFALWTVLVLAHLTYFYYLAESFEVPHWIFYISAICGGVWLQLAAFACLFTLGNLIVQSLNFFDRTRHLLQKLFTIRILKLFVSDHQFQALFTIILTVVLSLTHWYSCDKLVIHQHTFSLPVHKTNYVASENTSNLRMAMLSDLHGGAVVYREQIAKVVDTVNSLEVDAVLIVGDAIDAPRDLIEDRMEPLRHLRSRFGTFFVTGNHEYYYGNAEEWIHLFRSYGINVLLNEKVDLEGICLVGLNDPSSKKSGISNHSMDISVISQCPQDRPSVVLVHNPAAADKIVKYVKDTNITVDVILSGHTHAGQYYVVMPYVYWLLPYLYGIYDLNDDTKLLVSSGTLYQGSPMKAPFLSEIMLLQFIYS
ncbi:calcineurin-like phosphoesterase domain-containing protein [Ditylenchus destructor]|uniref:Calcineurin-like phosphoesterase domain-containing protein n=1 Tax=Ditylenchus destructor TaxID=166010 RepID=A0AAD4N6Q4_9BILA|nr:calcineurin-like phosphoesterase domain-containing protein [Ditylenchus destructor]